MSALTREQEELGLRDEVRAFIAERRGPTGDFGGHEGAIAFRAEALRRGYFSRWTPTEYGGAGLAADPRLELLFRAECRAAKAPLRPPGVGQQLVSVSLLEAGNEGQKQLYVRDALIGASVWAQGFSEPNAGSDLAALRTRATKDGDVWRIDGQKIWTTHGDQADMMILLARSRPDAPRHRGLSFFVLDLKSPGVTVRPIRQITGEHEFCEVFFDDVRVPEDNLVGGDGEGWAVANMLLKHERAWIGEDLDDQFERLVALARRTQIDGRPAVRHADIAHELAAIEGALLAHRCSAPRRIARVESGAPAGLIDMVAKLYATNVMERIVRLANDLLGEDGMGAPADAHAALCAPDEPSAWMRDYFWALAYAIAGGSSNIQRNVIADRGLRLPQTG